MDKYILLLYLGRKGAGNTYSYEMASAMLKRGHKLICVLSSDIENRNEWNNIRDKYNDSAKLYYINTYNSIAGFLCSLVFGIIKYRNILRELKKTNISCIYIPMLSMLAYVFVWKLKKPLITTVHDVNQHLGESSLIKFVLDSYVIRKSDRLIVLSRKFINDLSIKYHKDKKDVYYIPHANFSVYVPEGYKPDFERINKRILFFGRIHKYKGLEILLKAMCIVKESMPEIKLAIAGNGKVTKEEKTLIEELGSNVENNIRWISDNEIYPFFENIDFTVLPYIEASQSGVIPLSYSFGKSVIASDIGGLSEQVYEGCGILTEAGDHRKLAEHIINLYRNPDDILTMNKEAYNISNTILSWEYSSEKLSEIVNTIDRF